MPSKWKTIIFLSLLILLQPRRYARATVSAFQLDPLEFNPPSVKSALWYEARELFELSYEQYWLLDLIEEEAKLRKVPVELAYALVYTESRFKTKATHINKNGTVDRGVMQLNSSNKEYFSRKFWENKPYDSYNALEAVPIGLSYLRQLYDELGSWHAAIAAYNCGPYRYRSGQVPLSTRRYVQKISGLSYTLLRQKKGHGNARD